mmetsp:Transcript_15594/g.41027  ORF Transcript_15594/g.41027 Transcript_15594/m.41027 type:complete len:92 (-) Transcript_15594:535-810(-)
MTCTKIGQKIKDATWGSSHATAKWAKQGNVLSDWYRRKDCADWAFDEFLANPSSFELDEVYTWDVPQRVSINILQPAAPRSLVPLLEKIRY